MTVKRRDFLKLGPAAAAGASILAAQAIKK
jgi:hypothetical protein